MAGLFPIIDGTIKNAATAAAPMSTTPPATPKTSGSFEPVALVPDAPTGTGGRSVVASGVGDRCARPRSSWRAAGESTLRDDGGDQRPLSGGELQVLEDRADDLRDEGAVALGELDAALFDAGLEGCRADADEPVAFLVVEPQQGVGRCFLGDAAVVAAFFHPGDAPDEFAFGQGVHLLFEPCDVAGGAVHFVEDGLFGGDLYGQSIGRHERFHLLLGGALGILLPDLSGVAAVLSAHGAVAPVVAATALPGFPVGAAAALLVGWRRLA